MKLIDLHAHSSGISTCCKCDFREGIDRAKSAGLDGFVLTNHYTKSYVEKKNYRALAEEYLREYAAAKEYGDSVDFRVFFGIEVTAELYEGVHLLVYGIPPEFLSEHPQLCNDSQQELYREVHRAGGILVQAHPYRGKPRLMDLEDLDGVEISCHPHLHYGGSFKTEMAEIARQNGKLLTCGGDYHADVRYRPRCGVFVPDGISDGIALKDYLLRERNLRLRVHEPGGDWNDFTYQREDR